LVRAVDSVASNLSEGFGRYHYKEKKNFCYYSRGSLFETKTWIVKANSRGLISNDDFSHFKNNINYIGKILNNFIKSIGSKVQTVANELKEPALIYDKNEENIFPEE